MYIRSNATVGDYQIILVMDEGRYSTVYKAKSLATGNLVAIKSARKAENLFSKTYIDNERKIVGLLKSHVNIAKHFEQFEDENCMYFVMEYLEGFTLRREITGAFLSNNPTDMSFQTKKLYLQQIIAGLKHLHSLNIYHCDLKPENIVIVGDSVKIVDFGCSFYSKENFVKFKKKCINSTPGYGPPEIINLVSSETEVLLEGIDVWALGCVIYFMFSGLTPFIKSTAYETLQCVQNVKVKLNILPYNMQNICKGIFVVDIFKRLKLSEIEALINNTLSE